MTKVLIDIPPELNKKIDVKRAQEGEKRKEVISSRILFQEYPEIKMKLWKSHLWSRSYCRQVKLL